MNLANTYLGFQRIKRPVQSSSGLVSIRLKVIDTVGTYERLIRLGATVKYAPTKEESPGEILAMVYDPEVGIRLV